MSFIRPRRPIATAASVALIAGVATALVLAVAGCGSIGGGAVSTVGKVSFTHALAIPALAKSTIDSQGRKSFDLNAEDGTSHFVAGKATPTRGFNQPYLGPTLVANEGDRVVVHLHNSLTEATSVHWHGMHLPAVDDGGPHQMVAPGATRSPSWTIKQNATTLWYHPHLMGTTEEQVTDGMAGMFILHDEAEEALPIPHTYGVDDIPIEVQDVRLDAQGHLSTNVQGFVGPIGNKVLVNGTLGPYLDVTTTVVRLRLLNASAARVYRFGFSDASEFSLIGTDGGLLSAPVSTDHIQLAPGERAEILVRVSPGERTVLRSSPPDLGLKNPRATMNGGADSFDILQLRASDELATVGTVPASLVPVAALPTPTAFRTFTLDGYEINGHSMDMNRIDDVVTVGTTEQWTITNTQGEPHSFHVHDVEFQVKSVGGSPPPPELAGWKDTIYLRPHTAYVIVMSFADYSDPSHPYMFHCHMLHHEDNGMMGQFVVVKPGQLPNTNLGASHDH
jgi:FtsP/CotA-like multicopper oxidase with cupredoxin domain